MARRRKHVGSEVAAYRSSRKHEYHHALDATNTDERARHLDRAIAFQTLALSAVGRGSKRMGGRVVNAAPSEQISGYEAIDRRYAALGDVATEATRLDETALAEQWADMFPSGS